MSEASSSRCPRPETGIRSPSLRAFREPIRDLANMKIEQIKQDNPHWKRISKMFPHAVEWLDNPEDPGDYHFLGAIDENEILVGGSVIDIGAMDFGPLKDMTVGFLEDIEVLCKHRKKGIGALLLQGTLDYSWQKGCENVRWRVDYDNAAGIALYRKLGCAFVPEEAPDADDPVKQYTVVAMKPKLQHL